MTASSTISLLLLFILGLSNSYVYAEQGEDEKDQKSLEKRLREQVDSLTMQINEDPNEVSLYSQRGDAYFFFGANLNTLAVLLLALLLIWRHQSNIANLIAGKESRIGQKKAATDTTKHS